MDAPVSIVSVQPPTVNYSNQTILSGMPAIAFGNNDHNLDNSTSTDNEDSLSEEEAKRRREQLNRRPSYRQILSDLSSSDVEIKVQPVSPERQQQQMTNTLQQAVGMSLPGLMTRSLSPHNIPQIAITSSVYHGGIDVSPVSTSISHQQPLFLPMSTNMLGVSAGQSPAQLLAIGQLQQQQQQQQGNHNNSNAMMNHSSSSLSPMVSSCTGFNSNNNNNNGQSSSSMTISLTNVNDIKPGSLLLPGHSSNDVINSSLQLTADNLLQGYASRVSPSPSASSVDSNGQLMSQSDLLMPLGQGGPSIIKREMRLLKNREAAKECRRKKKEYVKCLENRVTVLENQNKALIEELKTLKELYCRKNENPT